MPVKKKKLPACYGEKKEWNQEQKSNEPDSPDIHDEKKNRQHSNQQKPEDTVDYRIKTFLDLITPTVAKFNIDHIIFGNTYRCVWAVRDYQTSTKEQALLRGLGEKDGVTKRTSARTSNHPSAT